MLAADRLVYATVPCLYHRWQRSVYSPGASYVIEVVTNFRGCRLPTAAVSSSMIRTQACRNSGNRYIADVIVRHRNPRLSAWREAHVAGVNIDAKVHESAPGVLYLASAGRSYPCAATPAPKIPPSPAAKAAT